MEENPEALMADGFGSALVGFGRIGPSKTVAVYAYEKCIEILMNRDGMDPEEATEYFDYNVQGAWVGENGPVFLYDE
mgnify:FL=1